MPVRRIVWAEQGVKVFDPAPTDTEICELYGGRNGVAARIIKVTRQVIPLPGGRAQEIITRDEILLNKAIGQEIREQRRRMGQEVRELARAT